MPRPPSKVDEIRRRLEAKEKAQKMMEAATPFKDKVRSQIVELINTVRMDTGVVFCLLAPDIVKLSHIRCSMYCRNGISLKTYCIARFS